MTTQPEQELLRAERELTEALNQGDFATLEHIYDNDYILTTVGGELQNKAQRIAALKATDPKSVSRNRDDFSVHLYGDTAVVTGHTLFQAHAHGGKSSEHRRFTHLWVKRQGRWRVVATQVTRIASEAAGQQNVPTQGPPSLVLPTKEDVAEEMRRKFAVFDSGNVDAILQNAQGAGFGYRTAAVRSMPWAGVDARDVAARGVDVRRQAIKQFLDSMEYYHTKFEELYTSVEGDIGLAWGIFVEEFKVKGRPPEKARVRFTETLKKEDVRWRTLLFHRDIQPFDEHGRYLTRLTLTTPR